MKNYLRCGLLLGLFLMTNAAIRAQDGNNPDAINDQQSDSPRKETKGFYLGLNLGAYFANKYDAQLYNGYGFDRGGIKLDFNNSWLNRSIGPSAPYQTRQTIETEIGNNTPGGNGTYTFSESDMPLQMRYSPTIQYGLNLRYAFNKKSSIIMDINGCKLTATGEFTLELTGVPPSNNPADNNTLPAFPIRGQEQRLWTDLGYHRVLGNNDFLNPYIEGGLNFTLAKFESNDIEIYNYHADITQVFDNYGNYQYGTVNITSANFGTFLGFGGQITLGTKFTIDLGYNLIHTTIKLRSDPKGTFQHGVIFRIIYM